MSRISLIISGDVMNVALNSNIIFSTADEREASTVFKSVCNDLEVLRELACKKINSIKHKSDMSADVREFACERIEKALEDAGVPVCNEIFDVDFEGFTLRVGVRIEAAEWHTNSPEVFEIVSATHRGADAIEFINTIGTKDVWDRLVGMIDYEIGSKK